MTKYSGKIENFETINKRCPNCYCQSYVIFEEKGIKRRRCTSCGAIYREQEYCYKTYKEELENAKD